jgi:hypothetical protein
MSSGYLKSSDLAAGALNYLLNRYYYGLPSRASLDDSYEIVLQSALARQAVGLVPFLQGSMTIPEESALNGLMAAAVSLVRGTEDPMRLAQAFLLYASIDYAGEVLAVKTNGDAVLF